MDTFQRKSFLESLEPKQAFILGGVATVLVLGTLGCVVLGTYVWKGSSSTGTNNAVANTVVNTPTTGNSAAAAGTTTVLAPVTVSDHTTGSGDITVVTYSDFQCPYCQSFDATMQQVMKDYAGKIKWVYRHFPLSFHANAMNAAEASECAAKQGKFWEYAVKLFEDQDTLGEDTYKKIATEVGLNSSSFDFCRSSDETLTLITEDQTSASAAGVRGTPSSFIISKDGSMKPVSGGAVSATTMKTLLDAELAK